MDKIMEKKYILVEIPNRNCKGIAYYTDLNLEKITNAKDIKDKSFKFRLKLRVDGQLVKKIYTIVNNVNFDTFLKALDYVISEKEIIRNSVMEFGTLRNKNKIEKAHKNIVVIERFIDKAEEWIEEKHNPETPSTTFNRKASLIIRATELHNKSVKEITTADINDMISRLKKEFAPNTLRGTISNIKMFLNDCENELVRWDKIKLPSLESVSFKQYGLKDDDCKKIVNVMMEYSLIEIDGQKYYTNKEMRNVFAFLLTGRRIGEVLKLEFKHFRENDYDIPKEISKIKKTLTFSLDDDLKRAVREQKEISKNNKLFNVTVITVRRHFHGMLKALGYPEIRIHDMRHLIASILIQNETAIEDISVMLGHQSTKYTESVYASKDQKQALRATNKFKDMMVLNKIDKKLEKLKILMPDKTEDELTILLEILN